MIIGGDDSDEIDYCGRFGNGGGLTQLTGRCWTLWRRWTWKPMNGECRQRVFWISTTLPLLPLSCSFTTTTTTKSNCHWFQLFRRKRWESQEKIMHASPQGEDLRRQKIANCVSMMTGDSPVQWWKPSWLKSWWESRSYFCMQFLKVLSRQVRPRGKIFSTSFKILHPALDSQHILSLQSHVSGCPASSIYRKK